MLKDKLYCYKCDEDVNVEYITKEVSHNINKENINIEATIPYCKKCGEELSDFELEETRYNAAYNKYRDIKRFLYPKDIKRIREKYGLSQRAFSRVLGFGESTINRYELGAMQDKANNVIIKLSEEPKNMIKLLKQNQDNLSDDESRMLSTKIDEIIISDSKLEISDTITISKEIADKIINDLDQLNKKMNLVDKKLETLEKDYREEKFNIGDDWPVLDHFERMDPLKILDVSGNYTN